MLQVPLCSFDLAELLCSLMLKLVTTLRGSARRKDRYFVIKLIKNCLAACLIYCTS